MDSVRSMLDELMGKDRDLPPEQRRGVNIHDKDVCKHELCGLCPYKLFNNTKSALGTCEYEIHDDHLAWEGLKSEWDALSDREKDRWGYERRLHRLLKRLIADMDRYIDKQQDRARTENAPKPLNAEQTKELEDLKSQAKAAMDLSEKAAEAGDVDASMKAAQHAENLTAEHQRLHKRYTDSDRRISVCEVCGVFIQSNDSAQRLTDHYEGKQYKGWKAVRDKFAELETKFGGGGGPGGGSNAYPISTGRDHREREKGGTGPAPEDGELPGGPGSNKDKDRLERDRRDRSRDRSRGHDRRREYRDSDRRRTRSRSRSRSGDRRDRRKYDEGYRGGGGSRYGGSGGDRSRY